MTLAGTKGLPWIHGCVLVLFTLTGCAKVYQKPSESMPIEQRREIYERQRASYDWFNGVRVDGRSIPLGLRSYPRSVEKYFAAAGAIEAGQRASAANSYYAWALGAAVTGILGGVALQNEHGWSNANWFALGALSGLSVEITIIHFGNEKHIKPATEAYNQFLKQNLRLETE